MVIYQWSQGRLKKRRKFRAPLLILIPGVFLLLFYIKPRFLPPEGGPEVEDEILTAINESEVEFKREAAPKEKIHFTTYKVRAGDTLWEISRRFGIRVETIKLVNNLKNNILVPGQILKIPSEDGFIYTVRRGDSLWSIAKKFKVDIDDIIQKNAFVSSYIRPGQKIFIPGESAVLKRYTALWGRSIRFIWPVRGRITSKFGWRRDPFTGRRRFHHGIDIAAPIGTPVKAAADGLVIFSGWSGGYGYVIIIKHMGGYYTVYGHNRMNLVRKGQRVRRGQIIAYLGNTGRSTGPHLHFEIRKQRRPLNPLRLLARR